MSTEIRALGRVSRRYVYVKAGDVTNEVRRIVLGTDDPSGPDAYIGDFIRAHRADDLLILGTRTRHEKYSAGHIQVEAWAVSRRRLWRWATRAAAALAIGVRILRWRPDRILSGAPAELLWVSVLAARVLRVPIVHSRHTAMPRRPRANRVAAALERVCVGACATVVCNGPFLAEELRLLGMVRSRICEFDRDLREFVRRQTPSGPPPELLALARGSAAIVMFVGRVQLNKGIVDLLDAFCMLPPSVASAVTLVYVGAGSDSALLAGLIRERRLADRVLMLGPVPHAQLCAVMMQATVVVTPTRTEFPEGRCMVVLESLAMGIPVLAPDFGPFRHAIKHGVDGMLFEPGDSEDLGRCLRLIVEQPDVSARLRRGARRHAGRLAADCVGFAGAVDRAFELQAEHQK